MLSAPGTFSHTRLLTSKAVCVCDLCNGLNGVVADTVLEGSQKLSRVIVSRLRPDCVRWRRIIASIWEGIKALLGV